MFVVLLCGTCTNRLFTSLTLERATYANLSVRKAADTEIYTRNTQSLFWLFVDGHRKADAYRKLYSFETDGKVVGNGQNSWNIYTIACATFSQNIHLYHVPFRAVTLRRVPPFDF